MTTNAIDQLTSVTEHAAKSAEAAIKTTQQAANEALGTLAHTLENFRTQTAPWLKHANHNVENYARQTAQKASLEVERYVVNDPMKAMLVAAASGAALMALVSLVTRHSRQP